MPVRILFANLTVFSMDHKLRLLIASYTCSNGD